MGHYEGNMAVLKRRFPDIQGPVAAAADDGSIEAVETKLGGFVPALSKEGKRLFIHSKFDPVKEAERFIGEIDTAAFDLFIVFGFGFGYHVEELLRGMGGDSLVLVIEKSPLMIRRAMECRDLGPLLGDERVLILIDPNEDVIAGALKGKSSRRTSLILHRGSFQAEQDYYGNLQHVVRSYLSTKDVNIATLAKFEKVWASNIARNIGAYIRAPGANIFFDKFRDVPAIVVAAGPSLRRSLEFIRRNRDRAVIVAVDTSYRILMKEGIEPHFCIVVDPQAINARYFEGSAPGRTVLIADPTVHPSVFRLFKGRVAMTGVAFELMKWIERLSGEKGEITHGGSVSTNAYDFARRLGAKPVYLAGQDLAFTGGYAHARGSYLDEQVHLRTGRLYTPEMFNRFQLTALPKILVKGIGGGTVHTNQKMMIFLTWFQKREDRGLVNATCDGALIPGVNHVAAADIDLAEPPGAIEVRIDELFNLSVPGQGGGSGKLLARIGAVQEEIEALLPLLDRAVGYSEQLLGLMKDKNSGGGNAGDQGKVDYLLKKLAETDRVLDTKKGAKDMISFTIQRVVHTITEGYDIDEDDDSLSGDELVAKRSLYLYRGLLDGARLNGRILSKMKSILGRSAP
ncbi:MAG: motility associated factor glycosyltransferase family protein [Spirochaetes bacterium]|nr:motility associated factor glycosyltransferase family protein [Spirochaetota bacterium]